MTAERWSASTTFLDSLRGKLPPGSRGDLHATEMDRALYSTDASIYLQMPMAAFTPRNAEEIAIALNACVANNIPILPRAAGTSLAGQTTGDGAFVIDISKHMHRLLEVAPDKSWAMVEPGIVRDTLNAMLAPEGVMFAPETSTSNRANVGGMIGNNSSGMMSIRYGTTISHTLGCEVMLADGTTTWFGTRDEMDDTGRRLLDSLMAIVNEKRALIEELYPKVIRRVGGYSLDAFLGENPNLSKIIVGSEGTLGFMTRAKVKLVKKPKYVAAVAIHFHELIGSLRCVPMIVKYKPLSAEFMDGPLIRMSLDNATTRPLMDWLRGTPEAVIPVEIDGDSREEVEARIDAMIAELKANGHGYEYVKLMEAHERFSIIETRKAGLGVMLKAVGDDKAISFIEDACVPIEHLADYAQGIYDIVSAEGLKMMTYGHASVGVLHLKPVVNLKKEEDRAKCRRISERAMQLCKKYHGSWSGEHGDGIARGAQNELFWGDEMMDVFRRVKNLFDPRGIMNPGKIFDTPDVMGPLRYTNGYEKHEHDSAFHFREEAGFRGAIEMCNGVGACRKIGSGTMCPSFMATRDEKDSTRGRANALRMALSGQLGPGAMTSDELYDVLDLCLECKACKTECPSNVDMAKMKSEFLYAYKKEHSRTMRDRVFAHAPDTAKLNAGLMAPLVNATLGVGFIRRTVNKALGVAVERELPPYATTTLHRWFKHHKPRVNDDAAREVVLFDDTFTTYHEPGIGRWAVRVLEHFGYRVRLARAGCCCRTFISKGFLDIAKQRGELTLDRLDVYARRNIPIVTLEPSCASSLRDDLPDLIDDVELGQRVRAAVLPIEEFLERELLAGRIKVDLDGLDESYLLHGHCHQKALNGTGPLKRLIGPARVAEVDSGCCGMAGSFGYEQEHYDISQQIGRSRLFPAVEGANPQTRIVANGFSCRHQIKDATGKRAMHFIEAFGRALKKKGRMQG